ncbi:peroxiredoxin [Aquabacterium sp.]|uniref:peroxiredoxin n=1 Tax=Aquabacterium sp. TaxID=1872578 RepID=UPI0035AE935A
MIKVGDAVPAVTLFEYMDEPTGGCSIGPNPVDLKQAAAGKTIALFAVPGAFTPTCSAQHLPGFIAEAAAFRAAGVDEIWCVSVNDAFVMGAWGREAGAKGVVRMLADGSADFAKALGLELDLTAKGLGLRSQRYSALIVDGVFKQLNLEGGGGYTVSDAQTLLKQVQAG